MGESGARPRLKMPESLASALAKEVIPAAAIPPEAVLLGDRAAQEVLARVRPTEASERQRADVVEHIRRLLGSSLGCEVFSFGSVPLKTYLPEGDIDMTVLGNTSHGSTLVNDVRCLLESEEHSEDTEFEVTDIQHIQAEVQLIKCVIQNIVVDISFNQIGGLCTLCFLELVDCHIGKNNLFKRSIILIKAWCYYESRMLGAHHGLISTYALETMVLYIFNMFYKHLDCPLAVLYRFLEYFSKFDWDNYGISLNGPIALSSLPDHVVELEGIDANELLFNRNFLNGSVRKLVSPAVYSGRSTTRFNRKFLNIIDPLRENNNLGRSVHRGNFNRIRSALSCAARKLGRILTSASEMIPSEIFKFFKHTLDLHCAGPRLDVTDSSFNNMNNLLSARLDLNLSEMLCNGSSNSATSNSAAVGDISYDNPPQNQHSINLSGLASGHIFFPDTAVTAQDCYSRSIALNGSAIDNCHTMLPWFRMGLCTPKLGMMQGASHSSATISTMKQIASSNSVTLSIQETKPSSVLLLHQSSTSQIADPSFRRHLDASFAGTIHESKEMKQLTSSSTEAQFSILSGDLDSQLKSLRQVQYHLEYMFGRIFESANVTLPVAEVDSDDYMDIAIQTSVPVSRFVGSQIYESSTGLYTEANATDSSTISYYSSESLSKFSLSDNHWDMNGVQYFWFPAPTNEPYSMLSPPAALCSKADVEKLPAFSRLNGSHYKQNSRGTGTFFPKLHYYKYKEHTAPRTATKKILPNYNPKDESKSQFVDDDLENIPEAALGHDSQNPDETTSVQNSESDGTQWDSKSETNRQRISRMQLTEGHTKSSYGDSRKNLVEDPLSQTIDGNSGSHENQVQTCQVNLSQHVDGGSAQGVSSNSQLDSSQLHQSPAQSHDVIRFGSLGPIELGVSVSLPCEEKVQPAAPPRQFPWPCTADQRPPSFSYLLKDEGDFPPLRG